jgi:hypothetical protein
MSSEARLDARFLDRGGCGDELYTDAYQKASMWLAGLTGEQSLGGGDGFEMLGGSSDDGSVDDFASH